MKKIIILTLAFFLMSFVSNLQAQNSYVHKVEHPLSVSLRGKGYNTFSVGPNAIRGFSTRETEFTIAARDGNDKNAFFKIKHAFYSRDLFEVNRYETKIYTPQLNTNNITAKDITANKVTLKVGSFPDYVFANDYNLMPLKEVATFIKKHQHLPNMKSEKEVVKEGMELKELTLKLVEKVEELTLYTIQQQKLIDNLQVKLNTLKK
ncbi:exported protein of unknown function [Tenacibaculum sp. 190524A02b]|uniref:hypothetical protein n=1 Tax=Tenacibaculum vairaonense TaxID=3137860 RepID=UPI0032B1C27E